MTTQTGEGFLSLLRGSRGGDEHASLHVYAAVYSALHRAARAKGAAATTRELVDGTFTALLAGASATEDERSAYLSLAARSMRQLLVDAARRRSVERGGVASLSAPLPGSLDTAKAILGTPEAELIALDSMLSRLALVDPKLAIVIELKFFAARSDGEAAAALGTPVLAARRAFRAAKALLFDALTRAGQP